MFTGLYSIRSSIVFLKGGRDHRNHHITAKNSHTIQYTASEQVNWNVTILSNRISVASNYDQQLQSAIGGRFRIISLPVGAATDREGASANLRSMRLQFYNHGLIWQFCTWKFLFPVNFQQNRAFSSTLIPIQSKWTWNHLGTTRRLCETTTELVELPWMCHGTGVKL
jgi:hypothetical protein